MQTRQMRTGWGVGSVLGLALVLAAGCSKEPGSDANKPKSTVNSTPVARVAGKTISEQDVDDTMKQIPQHLQRDYDGARGKLRLIGQLVDRELMVKAAGDAGMDRDPQITKQVEDFRRGLMMQQYQKQLVDGLPKPTDSQIDEYYTKHPQEFVTPARENASWIKCASKVEAEKARRRIVDRGEDFGKVAREVTTDKATQADGGLLGYFNPTGYIRGIPNDKRQEFADRVFALEAGDVSDVFPFDGAWVFVKIHEKTTERQQPLEKARDQIRIRLTPTFTDSLLQTELVRLRTKYKPQILFDADKEMENKSADELLKLATEAANPRDKIEYYRGLVKKYPTHPRADEAQFMIGFVYSEDLHDYESAKREFELTLKNYPKSDVVESTHYMLDNLGHPAPADLLTPGATLPPGAH
jgi:peptidyl-prolyl cis-trans isomerase C